MIAFLFSPSGRISRGGWWMTGIIQILGLIVGLAALVPLLSGETAATEPPSGLMGLLMVIAIIAFCWVGLCANIKRYHDRGKSGFWMLISLIPFIGPVWMTIELGLVPGTSEDNAYGPPPGSGRVGTTSHKESKGNAKLAKLDDEYFRNFASAQAAKIVASESRAASPSFGAAKPVFGKRT